MVSQQRSSANSRTKAKASNDSLDVVQEGKKMTSDVIEYITDYARENPGNAALWCLGVGFVLGWKLKPW